MDTRFLVTVLSVVDTGSFAACARQLNLTPAAVAQRVKAVEHQLGATLFTRKGLRVAPSIECRAILPRLRMIASAVQELAADLDPTGLASPLRVGAISTAIGDMIPGVLARFAEFAPRAKLSIVPGTSQDLYEQVINGSLDAAFLIKPDINLPKAIDCIVLDQQPFVIITQANDTRTLEQLIQQSHALIYDLESWGGRIVGPWLGKNVPPSRIRCELDALEAIVTSVSKGLGYAVIPCWPGLASFDSVRLIEIPGFAETRDLSLIHRKLGSEPVRLLAGSGGRGE